MLCNLRVHVHDAPERPLLRRLGRPTPRPDDDRRERRGDRHARRRHHPQAVSGPSSLVVVIEDDPQQGGDHVDHHRTPIVLASPWVKHGYVSHTHIDVRVAAQAVRERPRDPVPQPLVANAALPFDLFTSTPDYTPYTYMPRRCRSRAGSTRRRTRCARGSGGTCRTWTQPGLDAQVMRYLRGEQLKVLPKKMARESSCGHTRSNAGSRAPGRRRLTIARASSGANRHIRLRGSPVPDHLPESGGEELGVGSFGHARLAGAVAVAVPRAAPGPTRPAVRVGLAARGGPRRTPGNRRSRRGNRPDRGTWPAAHEVGEPLRVRRAAHEQSSRREATRVSRCRRPARRWRRARGRSTACRR